MAIRYIDSGFYKSPFVRGLKGSLKTLYSFIICDCSGSGIWVKDLDAASLYTGFKILDSDFKIFVDSGKAINLNDGKYFFPDFIEHQYPSGLSEKNPAQKNFIKELVKYDLLDENLKIKKTLQRPSKGSQVIVTVKEIVKETETVIKPEPENLIFPFDSLEFMQVWNTLIKTKKWRKKEFSALQASLKLLSGRPESEAIKMMENSIAGEWQGLFELKDKQNGNNKNGTTDSPLRQASDAVLRAQGFKD